MIEIKVPADINAIVATSFFNLKRKDIVYIVLAIVVIVVLNFLLHTVAAIFLTMLVVLIFAIPILIEHSNLFGISSEEFIMNIVRFTISHKKRHYESEVL